jgi:hypothetical protein
MKGKEVEGVPSIASAPQTSPDEMAKQGVGGLPVPKVLKNTTNHLFLA